MVVSVVLVALIVLVDFLGCVGDAAAGSAAIV